MNGIEAASYHVQRGLTYRFQMEPATWLIHPLHLFRDGVDGALQKLKKMKCSKLCHYTRL